MGLLDQLLGGGQQRQDYQDFTNRYDQGAPYDGYSGQEALNRYQQVTPHLSPEEYELSAEEAYSRMSPRERSDFARMLQQQARDRNVQLPGFQDTNRDGIDDRYQDPRMLAQMTSRMQQQHPGMLEQLLGGGAGGMGGGIGGTRGGMGGGAAGNMLDNPLAKAALAGIAAMAVKRVMSQR